MSMYFCKNPAACIKIKIYEKDKIWAHNWYAYAGASYSFLHTEGLMIVILPKIYMLL